jgi:mono/diheme cytochrome c family protein
MALGAVVVGAASCGSDGPERCSTDSAWEGGDEGSAEMHPGGNCIACHAEEAAAPRYVIAGTVMNDLHDDTDCNGVEGVTVEITGADGQVLTLATNAAGNFYLPESGATLAMPYTAKLLYQGRERVMATPQSTGACAACHSADGASGAPGRVLVP